jgi:predicted RNA polymerase sigma factor
VVQDARVSIRPDGAVERVWREQGARLWRSLVAFAGDGELASDAMAEAFAQALGRGDAVEAHDRWVWRASFARILRRAKSLVCSAAARPR